MTSQQEHRLTAECEDGDRRAAEYHEASAWAAEMSMMADKEYVHGHGLDFRVGQA